MKNKIDYLAMIAEYEQNALAVSKKAEYYANRAEQAIDEADRKDCEEKAISYRNIARGLYAVAKTLMERINNDL